MIPGLEGTVLENPYVFALFLIWSLAWKGWALWLAARRGEKIWFVALLVVNTVGILDIIYIFLVAKRKSDKNPPPASLSVS
jgi:methionyl-tRNA synthetase